MEYIRGGVCVLGAVFLTVFVGDFLTRWLASEVPLTLWLWRRVVHPLTRVAFALGRWPYTLARRAIDAVVRALRWLWYNLTDILWQKLLDAVAADAFVVLVRALRLELLVDAFAATCTLFVRVALVPIDLVRGFTGYHYVANMTHNMLHAVLNYPYDLTTVSAIIITSLSATTFVLANTIILMIIWFC